MQEETFKVLKEYLRSNRLVIGLGLIVVVLLFGGVLMVKGAEVKDKEIKIIESDNITVEDELELFEEKEEDTIICDIEGGVINPGVYRLATSSVVVDAIEAAGGFSRNADRERIAREINQASIIGNNSKIYIFTLADREIKVVSSGSNQIYSSSPSDSSVVSLNNDSGIINVNTATYDQLNNLPKIGPVLSQRIIDWREANDGFEVLEDLKKVKGIGDSMFEEIKELITVE